VRRVRVLPFVMYSKCITATAEGVKVAAIDKEMSKLLTVPYRTNVEGREQPLYTIPEAADYLGLQSPTLHTWFYGRHYPTKEGRKFWPRVITPADSELQLLSFYNLAEAHILAATRYRHNVPFPAVRSAIANVTDRYPQALAHPLLSHDFYTDGVSLFIKTIEDTEDISREQLSLKIVMDMFLERIVRDKDDNPFKVFPIVPGVEQKIISMTYKVSSSRPVIDGTGVQVAVIEGRHRAGDSLEAIAEDFDIPVEKIQTAVDYAEWKAKAA
jgi:uncharacterized protein (DUF433 family)